MPKWSAISSSAISILEPYGENPGREAYFWVPGERLAELEIVAWDSALTLLISREEAIVYAFRNAFPRSEDLETYNLGEPESEKWRKIWEEKGKTG